MKQLSLAHSSRNLCKYSYRVNGVVATGRRCHIRAAAVERKDVAATPSTAVSETPDVEVTFQLAKHVEFGSEVCITGDVDKLGCWNTKNSVSLDWSDGDVWKVACQLPAGASLAYKYIIKSGDKVTWQPCENLTVQVPPEANAVQIKDDWTGKGRSVDLSDAKRDVRLVVDELPVLLAEMSDSSAAEATVVEGDVEDSSSDAEVGTDTFLTTLSVDAGVESVLEQAMEQELSQTSIENLSVDKLKDHLLKSGLAAKGRKEQKQSLKAAQKIAGPMPKNGRTRSAA